MRSDLIEYIRRLSERDQKHTSDRVLKATEELGELAEAVLARNMGYATTHKFMSREKILEECADLLLCTLSVAYHEQFSDDEINDMLKRKSDKWARLQNNCDEGKFPLPFEIHITFNVLLYQTQEYRDACLVVGVKPIIIEFESESVTAQNRDVMTSSVILTDNRGVLAEVDRIVAEMAYHGFTAIRKKIETVPYHPTSPRLDGDDMPKGCYFESHFSVKISDPRHAETTRFVADSCNCHLSTNAFKKYSDGSYDQMLTMRWYKGTNTQFRAAVDTVHKTMVELGLQVQDPIVEFSLYDTNVHSDDVWLKN